MHICGDKPKSIHSNLDGAMTDAEISEQRRALADDELIVRDGYLEKEGTRLKGWTRRWCELTSWGNLRSSEGPDAPRIDTLPLCGCEIQAHKSKKRPHAFRIDIDSQGHKSRHVFTGATADESAAWEPQSCASPICRRWMR